MEHVGVVAISKSRESKCWWCVVMECVEEHGQNQWAMKAEKEGEQGVTRHVETVEYGDGGQGKLKREQEATATLIGGDGREVLSW